MERKWALMKFAMCLLSGILLSFSAIAETIPIDYDGPDAGYAVIGIGATSATEYSSYTFLFRKIGEAATGRLTYRQNNFISARAPDYKTEEENGVVEIASLQPGRYELMNLNIFRSVGMRINWSSRKEFSIPFEVKPREVVYLGNYQANDMRGRNVFGWSVRAGAFFVVEDRFRIDLGLAKARVPSLSVENARNATPDVRQVGTPLLVSREQVRRAKESRSEDAPQQKSGTDQETTVTDRPPGQVEDEK